MTQLLAEAAPLEDDVEDEVVEEPPAVDDDEPDEPDEPDESLEEDALEDEPFDDEPFEEDDDPERLSLR